MALADSLLDTDTLIALVSSIVSDRLPQVESSSVLEAILYCDGDVELAANYLLENAGKVAVGRPKGKKRAHSGLDAWLQRDAPSPKRKPVSRQGSSPKPTDVSVTRHLSPATSVQPPNLLSILQQPSSSGSPSKKPPSSRKPKPPSSVPRLPPLTLPSPSMVAQHTPCTLHCSVLPPELACKLFYTMVDLARGGWKRNKWWLFERMVESPHRTAFFVRKDLGSSDPDDKGKGRERAEWTEAAQYWYNGTPTDIPPAFPPEMEEACYIIESVVNAEMRKRKRFDMEWRPPSDTPEPLWQANVAASNCYEGGKETVGWHSDQLTYLGPYPTIASLSLGTRRTFSLRDVVQAEEQEKRHARTYNIPLPHNSLVIMHATTQERFKHSIPPQSAVDIYKPILPRSAFNISVKSEEDDKIEPSNIRINITFRFYRPDFRPESTPRCKCGIPMILRPDMKNTIAREKARKPASRSGGAVRGSELDEREGSGEGGEINGDEEPEMKYWWTCYAYAQNEGKGCGLWKVMDLHAEGRGWKEGLE